MAELRETITRKEIESVKPVPKKKGSYRVADSVTAEQHHQAFGVIVKALSRNVKYVRSYSPQFLYRKQDRHVMRYMKIVALDSLMHIG